MNESPRTTTNAEFPAQRVQAACARFAAAWQAGQRPQLEDYLESTPERRLFLRELLILELAWRRQRDEQPGPEEYRRRFPEDAELIEAVFRQETALAGEGSGEVDGEEQTLSMRPEAGGPATAEIPDFFGRYQITARLGSGKFGEVYRAYDTTLHRTVAIKVPHRHWIVTPKDLDAYVAEARVLAGLNHPGIVTVHDIARTPDGLYYFVSQFIEGSDLKSRMAEAPIPLAEAVQIVARVAEALHHAHQRGLVHRDIKPANILLDTEGRPFIADFGLALREEEFGQGPVFVGTPAYMSPEQARGEGHLVDGRSDVYSLSVVFYEMLTGQRPFQAETRRQLLEQIRTREPRPPRQLRESVPRQLDRICLKALAGRASDRYSTALDLAEELRYWQAEQQDQATEASSTQAASPGPGLRTSPVLDTETSAIDTDRRPIKVVPKGLRSFEAEDADFFLELLPGPRDRHGLPDSIRFWKARLEQTDPEETFRVGLIYGPSGCGKSSLVKAGLLPRLDDTVHPLYVEAGAESTEAHLLRGLRKRFPNLLEGLGLAETLASVRRGGGVPPGKKILLVLDQFEQWLHAHEGQPHPELVQALRQCDGQHLQCLLLIRDDFGMAAARFMEDLEIPIVQGENFLTVDLFDKKHARKVLSGFGRAFGQLPADLAELTAEQQQFLDRSVEGLTENGYVVPVRLALFAEMVRAKPWTPATLREVGGIQGIGVTFLEEVFTARAANPRHQRRLGAAQAVLKRLLPEQGTDIKGNMRSYEELLEVSGYAQRPKDFEDLMRILDSELRLVTPIEAESLPDQDPAPGVPGRKYYQLTHDFLVPALRDWLTRKRKETWRGRTELRLEERTAQWHQSRQRRFLPSLPEYLLFALAVPAGKRKPPERRLMRAAGRYHALRGGLVLSLLLLVGLALQLYVWHLHHTTDSQRAATLVEAVLNASPSDVGQAIDNLKPLRQLALAYLHEHLPELAAESSQRLHAALALAAFGEIDEAFLLQRIPFVSPTEARNLIAALAAGGETVKAELLRRASDEQQKPETRARYALTLLGLGDSRAAEQVLRLAPDPVLRTAFIHGFPAWHGNLRRLATLLRRPDGDPGFRSGICAALGLVEPVNLAVDEKEIVTDVLSEMYSDAPDGGTHSSAGWSLRQWAVPLPALERLEQSSEERDWFINPHQMTMLKIHPDSFLMGIDPQKLGNPMDARPHKVQLSRGFFICDREILIDLFQLFIDDPQCPREMKPQTWKGPDKSANLTSDCPVNMVSWFDAVLFCNWLSIKQGRQPCYARNKVVHEGKAVEEWLCDFSANGYRLPTEAEWEYACRAGTTTEFAFGHEPDANVLSRHVLLYFNSQAHAWPGGTKLPNDWGLFDMHGNLAEWCWDWYHADIVQDQLDPQGPAQGTHRVIRGGDYLCFDARQTWSGGREQRAQPEGRMPTLGFRVVCTQITGSK